MELFRRRQTRKWYSFAVAAFLAALAVSVAFDVGYVQNDALFIKIVYPVSVAIPAAAGIFGAIRYPGPARPVFIAFAVTMTLSTAGAIGTVLEPSTRFPTFFDYLNVGVYFSGAVAVLFATANKSLTYVLDGLIIACSILFVTWGFLLQPVIDAFDGNLIAATVSLIAPSGDVMLIAAALLTLHRGSSMMTRAALIAFCIGLTCDAASGVIWSYFGRATPEPPVAIFFWVASGLILSIAALCVPHREVPRLKPVSFGFMLLPYPAVLAAIAAGIVMVITDAEVRPATLAPAALAALCLMVRQLLAGFENVTMARKLESTVQQLRVRELELHNLALHDPLTSLPNRRYVDQRIVNGGYLADLPFAVMLLDVDDFKSVNDGMGHDVGDELLVLLARVLSEAVRAGDVVVRLGGDEFAIVLPGATEADALRVAERVRKGLAAVHVLAEQQVKISVSIGLAMGQNIASLDSVMRQADMAMYERKKVEGKGGVAVFSPS